MIIRRWKWGSYWLGNHVWCWSHDYSLGVEIRVWRFRCDIIFDKKQYELRSNW